MRLVITGASGFVGRQIIPILRENGVELLLVGRSPKELALQYPEIDTCGYDEVEKQGIEADALLHLAVHNVGRQGSDEEFHRVNVTLLEETIVSCKAARIPRLIYTSSLHASSRKTPYAKSKAGAEDILNKTIGLTICCLRLPVVYGTGQFAGNLKILNRIPGPFDRVIFQVLSSLRPTLHVTKLADEICVCAQRNHSIDEVLSDGQSENLCYRTVKKSIDLGFVFCTFALLWWLLIIVWILIKFSSRGPGILSQERVGRFGMPFTCYKFRTMAPETEQAGTHTVSAASITPIGHFLRKTKIDELPQAFNVLKNEMSLVGPRPCLPMQSDLVEERKSRGVLNVLPGITGYAQVKSVDMSRPVQLAEIDERYIKLRTLPMDLHILLKTLL